MYQIVTRRGSYEVRLDASPIFARFEDAQAWVRDIVDSNAEFSPTGPRALSVDAIVAEDRGLTERSV